MSKRSEHPSWIDALRQRYASTGGRIYFDDLLKHMAVGQTLATPMATWLKPAADTLRYGARVEESKWWQLDVVELGSFRAECEYVFSGDSVDVTVCDDVRRTVEGSPGAVSAKLDVCVAPEDVEIRHDGLVGVAYSPTIDSADVAQGESDVGRKAER